MTRDDAERLLGALESIMYYRDAMNEHPNDRPRNARLADELQEAREVALGILEGVEHVDPESLF